MLKSASPGFSRVEQKEYPVPVFSARENSLEFLDSDGNPFNPSGPLKYSIIGDDGSTLKEGTLQDSNIVTLEGVTAKSFRVIIDSHFVVRIEGIETPDEEADSPVEQIDRLVIPPSSDVPDDDFQILEDLDEVSSQEDSDNGDQEDGSNAKLDSVEESGGEESENIATSKTKGESDEREKDKDSSEKTDGEKEDDREDSEDVGSAAGE